MKITGIIAEYNPFHNGHLYHLKTAKELTSCDYIVVVMSGNYTQRGEAAIFDKYTRAYQALFHGADAVFELPSLFSTSSAEGFASGAISLLDKLNICHDFVFGSETDDIEFLKRLAAFLNKEPEEYRELLKSFLRQGDSFPKAREKSLVCFFPENTLSRYRGSNDVLALEYCRAIDSFNSTMKPLSIRRLHNNYHDSSLSASGDFSSATAIRNRLNSLKKEVSPLSSLSCDDLLKKSLPSSFLSSCMQDGYYPLFPEDFSLLLHTKLLRETRESLMKYLDMNKELADRIIKYRNNYTDIDAFCQQLKTKEMTYSRISRVLLHILLEITSEDYSAYKEKQYCPYARLLGFRKSSSSLLHRIKKEAGLPVITKPASASSLLSPEDFSLFHKEITHSHIYQAVLSQKYHLPFKNEYTKTPIILL